TVFADLVVAVNVGVILAVPHFLRRMSETLETQPVDARSLRAELADLGVTELPRGVLVYGNRRADLLCCSGKLRACAARNASSAQDTHPAAASRAIHGHH